MTKVTNCVRGVVSPLISNLYLHHAFDMWMSKYFACNPCKLADHPKKTRIINMRGITEEKHPRSFDFLGFTFKPYWTKTAKGFKILITNFISQKSMSSIMDKFRKLRLHKRRKPLEFLARILNPITRGVINYYCKIWSGHTDRLWKHLNHRIMKWVIWEKGLYVKSAVRWLRTKFRENPNLFYHWKIVHP